MRINHIEIGDARVLSKEIPDESVGLVFTDPVYDQMEDYDWLGAEEARVLKPDKPLLVWFYVIKQFEVKQILDQYLTFRLPLYYTVLAKSAPLYAYKVNIWTTPCLVFSKGKYTPREWTVGTVTGSRRRVDSTHKWNKNEAPISNWLSKISYPDDLVWDPFVGWGVTAVVCKRWGRRFLASEIDPVIARGAQKRVQCTRQYVF